MRAALLNKQLWLVEAYPKPGLAIEILVIVRPIYCPPSLRNRNLSTLASVECNTGHCICLSCLLLLQQLLDAILESKSCRVLKKLPLRTTIVHLWLQVQTEWHMSWTVLLQSPLLLSMLPPTRSATLSQAERKYSSFADTLYTFCKWPEAWDGRQASLGRRERCL